MSLLKGWWGEKKTGFWLWLFLNKEIYRRFHNVIIPAMNGTTQIDHIVISRYGIFIVETKNKDGWIFGDEYQDKWTQVIYRFKHSFQNPLRQTYRQKKSLSAFLGVNEKCINDIVFFVGRSRFKSQLPPNVLGFGLNSYIKKFRDELFSQDEVDKIAQRIELHLQESTLTNRDHVESLNNRLNSTSVCPKCGMNLLVKTAMKGPNAGKQFFGCQNYPRCKFTREL